MIGLSRALDMMLTARTISGRDAEGFGLANRVVPSGSSRTAAEDLAHRIAQFPEIAMLSDRASTYVQAGLPLHAALEKELQSANHARRQEASEGAKRFASGAGRHGVIPTIAVNSEPRGDA
jgi:enoyl-CoA hydratase